MNIYNDENFFELYKTNENELSNDRHIYFRYLCFKSIELIKKIEIPYFTKNNANEAVFIEYRILPHVDFLIRNTILKLNETWSHTVICGNLNYEYMKKICTEISPNIKVIYTDFNNLPSSDYSRFLVSKKFWDLLYGEKILIYQEDSIIFNNNINDFLHFDFIGAPFLKSQNDTRNLVGNGGLSIRTKKKMIEVIDRININQTRFESSTIEYMGRIKANFPPEDVYFSKNMQDLNIGKVADWDSAYLFSSEVNKNTKSWGGHKFWISDEKWKKRMKLFLTRKEYSFNNDICEYLKFIHLDQNYDKTKNISNAFDVDLYFCNNINNLKYTDLNDILNFIKNKAIKGFIYHPKQIVNIYPAIKIYSMFNDIYIKYDKNIYKSNEFVNKYLYNLTYDELSSKIITNKYDNLNKEISLLLLCFIGDKEVGIDLMNKIIEYKKIEKINVAFCFISSDIANFFKDTIKNNFQYYSVYISKNLGTDITPTLLMYNDISKNYKFKHIIKLHTKSIKEHYLNLTNFLLSKQMKDLISKSKINCNCISNSNYYVNITNDHYNKLLLNENENLINMNNSFVAGTIFYCKSIVLNNVVEFIKNNNYKSYLLNNLYENNSINKDYSPIHFLERLFGIIKI